MSVRIVTEPVPIMATGSERFASRQMVRAALELEVEELGPNLVVIHGAEPGADALTDAAAWRLGLPCLLVPADWSGPCRTGCSPGHRREAPRRGTYCPAARVHRDQQMIELKPVHCLAFVLPGRDGECAATRATIHRAQAAGITVRTYESRR